MRTVQNAPLLIGGREYRKNAGGVFKIPLTEVCSIPLRDIPVYSSVEVTGLPSPGHAYSIEARIACTSIGGKPELNFFIYVRFMRPLYDSSISSSICLRRLRHIRQGFQSLVSAGILDEGVDHLDRTRDGWLCGILYRKMPNPAQHETLREIVMPAIESFHSLVRAEYRMLSLCYASEDKPFVERLASSLDEQNFDLWYERREMRNGASLAEILDGRTEETTHIVAVVSKGSAESPWLQQELSAPSIKKITERPLPIIPLLIDGSTLPSQLAPLNYADFQTKYQKGFGQLMDLVSRPPG